MSCFKFHVRDLAYGWRSVVMYIKVEMIVFNASYLGPNPLT